MNKLDYEKVFNTLVKETADYLVNNSLSAMVLGISGGIDSTVVAAICHEVSKQTGIPLIGRSLPIKNKKDEFDVSKLVGEAFCDDFKVINLKVPYNEVLQSIMNNEEVSKKMIPNYNIEQTPIANGNIQARLRMIYLYNLASIHKGLVMSTDNMTEYLLGFWTLHGDVGDFDPIQDLWKTEVYGLAKWLHDHTLGEHYDKNAIDRFNALKASIALTPTDGLGISNSDLEQIGAKDYDDIDAILQEFQAWYRFPRRGIDVSQLTRREQVDLFFEEQQLLNIDIEVIMKVMNRHVNSEFKRKKSPIFIPRSKYEN